METGERDLIRAALACAGSRQLLLKDVFGCAATNWPTASTSGSDTRATFDPHRDGLLRGMQWAGRYAGAEPLQALAVCDNPEVIRTLPFGLDVAASIREMNEIGRAPPDVAAFNAEAASPATEAVALVALMLGDSIDDCRNLCPVAEPSNSGRSRLGLEGVAVFSLE